MKNADCPCGARNDRRAKKNTIVARSRIADDAANGFRFHAGAYSRARYEPRRALGRADMVAVCRNRVALAVGTR